MIIPRKRPRPKMGVHVSGRVQCPGHLAYVRRLECSCKNHERFKCDGGPSDAHHYVTRGAGGGDDQTVPLCRFHHMLLDSPGWSQKRLEAECGVDFAHIAEVLWKISPAARRYRAKQARAA